MVAAQRRALSGIKDAGLQEAAAARRAAIEQAWRLAAAVRTSLARYEDVSARATAEASLPSRPSAW